MLGTLVNVTAIVAGTTAGCLIGRRIGERYRQVLFTVIGLSATVLGLRVVVSGMNAGADTLVFIVSIVLGGLLGTLLDLDGRSKRLAERHHASRLLYGLTTGCLLYCIGTLSILGPMMSALYGDNAYLYTNSTLDIVTATVLSTTYGWGMLLAAPVLFCWQGGIYLATLLLRGAIPDTLVTNLTTVGGVLLICSGLSVLGIKDSKTLNLLPALLIPILFALLG